MYVNKWVMSLDLCRQMCMSCQWIRCVDKCVYHVSGSGVLTGVVMSVDQVC